MKYAAIILLVVVSFFVGRQFAPTPAPEVKVVQEQVEVVSCSELAQFKNDFEEYQSLKAEADKYKKAKEILGKIMTLFLVDIGLRTAKIEKANPSVPTVALDSKPCLPPSPGQKTSHQAAVTTDNAVSKSQQMANARLRKRFEVSIVDAQRESEVSDSLSKLKIDDLFSELKSSRKLSEEEASLLNGRYVGEITFFNNKPLPWTIEWSLNLRKSGTNWSGPQLIILTDSKGKVFSRSRNSGILKDFSGMQDSSAILINVYGDDGYLQVYPAPQFGKLYGNYYEKKGLDQFIQTGTAVLQKVD